MNKNFHPHQTQSRKKILIIGGIVLALLTISLIPFLVIGRKDNQDKEKNSPLTSTSNLSELRQQKIKKAEVELEEKNYSADNLLQALKAKHGFTGNN